MTDYLKGYCQNKKGAPTKLALCVADKRNWKYYCHANTQEKAAVDDKLIPCWDLETFEEWLKPKEEGSSDNEIELERKQKKREEPESDESSESSVEY